MKKLILIALWLVPLLSMAQQINSERTITVNGTVRKYVLYVPDHVKTNPALVVSLHGASGHDTDRSPFRTSVADKEGCIVVYPQGLDQYFPAFGDSIPGWNATGEANEDLDFFKAIINEVSTSYAIDRQRVYCCGFSNGGMMTYSNAATASGIFAALASISGFQLNEFHQRHTGYRPTPFLHIHGKADGFVKYSCMPTIRDNMIARNGCNPIPVVTQVDGKYTKSVYAAEKGGAPYVYYEIDGMGHNDFTKNTEDDNSAQTMWNFMSQYTLSTPCDTTLKWRLNIDAEGFDPTAHSWTVSNGQTVYRYGRTRLANNADNNVYPSLQFEKSNYEFCFESTGIEGDSIKIRVESLTDQSVLFSKRGAVGEHVVMAFTVDHYDEYKITIQKRSATDRFTSLAIHACDTPAADEHCTDDPADITIAEGGELIEIPQDQGTSLDNFSRTALSSGTDYNTYTATGNLQIAFKMVNIDVNDCDYVVIKFSEPVAAGWHAAFWDDIRTVDVPAGSSEYRFDLEPQMVEKGLLPQICLMTLFGGYASPLTAKVKGVYKHSLKLTGIIPTIAKRSPFQKRAFNLAGLPVAPSYHGIVIDNGRKVLQ